MHGRRSCVLLYGWLGSTPRQLRAYEQLLAQPGRAVVPCTLPASSFFRGRRAFEDCARSLARSALAATAGVDDVGLFGLSGNGSTAVGLMLRELRAGGRDSAELLGRIRGVVYDSGPVRVAAPVLATGFVSMAAAKVGLAPEAALAIPGLRPGAEAAFRWLYGGRSELAAEVYGALDLPVPHLLLFSRADAVIPPEHVQRFAEELRARRGPGAARLEEFQGSEHVYHYRRHPERYREVTTAFLGEVLRAPP